MGLDAGENENNKILAVLLSSAEHLVEKVLRRPLSRVSEANERHGAERSIATDTPETVKTAVLFTVWQLYFHRDNKEFDSAALETTLAVMLSDLRKKEF